MKDSSRNRNVYIEHDVPAAQRAINSNFRTLLNALGESNLQLKGSRISVRQNEQDQLVPRNRDTSIRRKQKIAVFPLVRPTLTFCADPAVFIVIKDKIKIFSCRPTLNI